jgi:hypothetical protein
MNILQVYYTIMSKIKIFLKIFLLKFFYFTYSAINLSKNLSNDFSRTNSEITKMFKESNIEYKKKYGNLFKKFDIKILKDKMWNTFENVFFILYFIFFILYLLNLYKI